MLSENLNRNFDAFPWDNNKELIRAWQLGQTGYPIVDAGMKELYTIGWMHNRVRMIVGSFLTKNLLLHWKNGEEWFFDTLVDADVGSNSAGWQWISGCGADASPYFRIFNPILQGQKFDPDGDYVKIQCYDWSEKLTKEKNWIDHLRIGIAFKEFRNWKRN